MASIITGAAGTIAYWENTPLPLSPSAFDVKGNFHQPELLSFAGLSVFADNQNHAPSDFDGAVSWDAGLDLLFRIAGAR